MSDNPRPRQNVRQSASAIDRHVGRRIQEYRALAGLRQRDLAEGIGVTVQQFQKFEAGANIIHAGQLYVIAEHLGVPIGHLFSEAATFGNARLVRRFVCAAQGMRPEMLAVIATLVRGMNEVDER